MFVERNVQSRITQVQLSFHFSSERIINKYFQAIRGWTSSIQGTRQRYDLYSVSMEGCPRGTDSQSDKHST